MTPGVCSISIVDASLLWSFCCPAMQMIAT